MAARRPPVLLGRAGERQAFDRLLENVRGGQSAVLVVRGQAGVGKPSCTTALGRRLGFVSRRSRASRLRWRLPVSGVHQLCAPMFARLDALPKPQRDALSVALGLASRQAPDRFLVGLAVLSPVSAVAEGASAALLRG